MTDKTRAELRRDLATLVACAQLPHAFTGPAKVDHDQILTNAYRSWAVGVCVPFDNEAESQLPPPPLTTAQQLALSVLVGEPDRVVLSALCDLLIEQGHEYAVAVAEKARRDERERCRKLVASLADAAMWAGDSSHGVLYSLCDDL